MQTRVTVRLSGCVRGCILTVACAPLLLVGRIAPAEDKTRIDLAAMVFPILFVGDAKTAYRDPAAIYHDGTFYLYFTIGKIEPDKSIYWYTAWAKSRDMTHWTDPKIFTPRDQTKNFANPGCVVRDGESWALCLQTYPTPSGRGYGDHTARIWTMRSRNLEDTGDRLSCCA